MRQTKTLGLLKKKKKLILDIAAHHGARNVRIFGSVARGTSASKSDIDFLVDFERGRSYLDLVGMWQDLEDSLGKKVDVLTPAGISPYLRDKILSEAIPL